MLNTIYTLMSICFLALLVSSCAQKPDFGDVPKLEFVSMSKRTMNQGITNEDSILITLAFEDGDGDIGANAQDLITNMVVTDNRTGDVYDRIKLPEVPPQGSTNGIKGTIFLKLFNTCCTFPEETNIPACSSPDDFPTNELTLDITITDREGNESNAVTTFPIELRCN